MSNFKKLRVWQSSKELALEFYRITGQGKVMKDFGFCNQIRGPAISISSNIAEGDESGSDKMAVRFFNIAKGSSAELYTQLVIGEGIGYFDQHQSETLIKECESISSILYRLIEARKE